jgi:xanthine dehydrogenase accessory factor
MSTLDFYRKVVSVMESQAPAWAVTVISATDYTPQKTGARMIVFADGSIFGTIGGGDVEHKLIQEITTGRMSEPSVIRYSLTEHHSASEGPNMFCGGEMEFFVEPLQPGNPLYIIGGGHCAMELSALASRTGFSVTVLDERPEWATMEKHPTASRVVCTPIAEIAQHIQFTPRTYIVIMTHGHEFDELALKLCLPHETKYIGMIGSRNKSRNVLDHLRAAGFSEDSLSRVHSPIGLPIGSHTPAEIAVSISAELIAAKNSQE